MVRGEGGGASKARGAQPVESCVYDATALFAVLAEVYQTVMFGERGGWPISFTDLT